MKIEFKNLSETEIALFFSAPNTITKTFFYNKENKDTADILQRIAEMDENATLMLAKDFIYIKSSSPETLEDIKTIALAEISDYLDSPYELKQDTTETAKKIEIILKVIVAPFLKRDGGNIELVSYQNNIVQVRFLGKCHGCPYAKHTLKEHVEKNLLRYFPEIEEVSLQ